MPKLKQLLIMGLLMSVTAYGQVVCGHLLPNKLDDQHFQQLKEKYIKAVSQFNQENNSSVVLPEHFTKSETYSAESDNLILRLSWSLDYLKRSKGKVLFLPFGMCASGSHCLNSMMVSDKKVATEIKVNSPYAEGFCKGIPALEEQMKSLRTVYSKSGEADCLRWIQGHRIVNGGEPGTGYLSPLKIKFSSEGKLKFDGARANLETSDKEGHQKLSLAGTKNSMDLFKAPNGDLKEVKFNYKNGTKSFSEKYTFEYHQGQCVLASEEKMIEDKVVVQSSIEACKNLQELTADYKKAQKESYSSEAEMLQAITAIKKSSFMDKLVSFYNQHMTVIDSDDSQKPTNGSNQILGKDGVLKKDHILDLFDLNKVMGRISYKMKCNDFESFMDKYIETQKAPEQKHPNIETKAAKPE